MSVVTQFITGSKAIVLHGRLTAVVRQDAGDDKWIDIWECDHSHTTHEEGEACARNRITAIFPDAVETA